MSMSRPYEVHLEVFEGPLDLLLHLIKKNDLDINNIPISQITKEYLDCLELMKELNLDVAGDFLVMASTLMQIKARSLLPAQEASEEDGPDPRAELVSKLVEYQKFKQAAEFLERRGDEFKDVFFRGVPNFAEREKSLDIRIFDLLSTLREILDRTDFEEGVVAGEEYRIEDKMEKILGLLEKSAYIKLRDVFAGERARRAVITCFLALLELIKLQKIFARQERAYADILIYKKVVPLDPVWPSGTEETSDAAARSDAAEGGVGADTPAESEQPRAGSPVGSLEDEDAAQAEALIRENLGETGKEA